MRHARVYLNFWGNLKEFKGKLDQRLFWFAKEIQKLKFNPGSMLTHERFNPELKFN